MEESKRPSVISIGTEGPRLSDTNARVLEYWLILSPWLRTIIVTTVVMVSLVFVGTKFIMSPWYRAQAVIRPASQEGPTSATANWIGSAAGSALAALGAATGLGQAIPNDASEFMLVMKSFDFTTELIHRHHLEPILRQKGHLGRLLDLIFGAKTYRASDEQNWMRYKTMEDRFHQEYDDKLGNLTISIIDRNRETARQMLGYYIADLRDVIRNRALHDTASAVASLEDEMDKTADPMVRTQLARLIAQQIQQEKMAQAQADFAFTVVEPPYTGLHPVKPATFVDCVIVALLVPIMFVVAIVFYYRVYMPIRAAQESLTTRSDPGRSEQDRMPFTAAKR
jgi:capsular polysaccharide biosynthesis protein